jgi:hypothetical protein
LRPADAFGNDRRLDLEFMALGRRLRMLRAHRQQLVIEIELIEIHDASST